MSVSLERLVRNQVLFREVNDRRNVRRPRRYGLANPDFEVVRKG
jgi:hypothetical protein